MKRLVFTSVCLASVFAIALGQPVAAPPGSPILTDAEVLDACAESLPEQLACKQDFCSAMVDIRKKHQPRFAAVDRAEMIKACLEEIAVDGTGDLKARRGRCEGWSKGRPPMKVQRTDADAAKACFKKATCAERIACWAPITDKQMASMKAP